ncbi:MAG: 23S rRNA (uracil(1939)-C(5))-methyltransferase RlmD [Microscillaceae bacterium]
MASNWKNKILPEVKILDVVAEGKCLARFEERVVFVPGQLVAPGDVVDLQVMRRRKNYLEAVPIRFHHYSPVRVAPACPHFGHCGGCKWQHLPYALQLQYKQQQVLDNLRRLAKIELPEISPILPSENLYFYRNKLEFTFSHQRWRTPEELHTGEIWENEPGLGFHVPGRFDKVLDLQTCHLQAEPSNALRDAVRDYARQKDLAFFDLRAQTGFLRNLVIRTASTGDVMVLLIFFEENEEARLGLLEHLRVCFPQVSSWFYLINPKKNDAYQDLVPVCYAGQDFIEEQMEDLRFRIGPLSFYQTNSAQAYRLYQVARAFAALEGHEVVYDLYTGTGTIANFVARQCQKVIGLEYVPAAIEDARLNAARNGIHNATFFAGDIKDLLNPAFLAAHGRPEVVITDPPRAGMHEEVVQMLLEAAPARIVYVSCNPATQARDLAWLDAQYRVNAVQPVDMFPQTHHVENVVQLIKRP